MTIARYYTPDEEYIHEKGIEPDVTIEYDAEAEKDPQIQKAIEILNQKIEENSMKQAG